MVVRRPAHVARLTRPYKIGRAAKSRARVRLCGAKAKCKRARVGTFVDQLEKHAPRLAQLLRHADAYAGEEEQELVRELTSFAVMVERAEALFIGAGRWLVYDDGDEDERAASNKARRQRMQRFREEARVLLELCKGLRERLDEFPVLTPAVRQHIAELRIN